ncbi:hypothetical protein [Arthrobacter sp. HLT1-21]
MSTAALEVAESRHREAKDVLAAYREQLHKRRLTFYRAETGADVETTYRAVLEATAQVEAAKRRAGEAADILEDLYSEQMTRKTRREA